MRLLVDNSLSPRLASALRSLGHDALHVCDLRLGSASDQDIFERASADGRWIVAQDTDFAPLLYQRPPSIGVFLLRLRDGRVDAQVNRLSLLSSPLITQLGPKTIVVVEETRIRIRTFQ